LNFLSNILFGDATLCRNQARAGQSIVEPPLDSLLIGQADLETDKSQQFEV